MPLVVAMCGGGLKTKTPPNWQQLLLVESITNYGEMQNIRIPILMHLDVGWR